MALHHYLVDAVIAKFVQIPRRKYLREHSIKDLRPLAFTVAAAAVTGDVALLNVGLVRRQLGAKHRHNTHNRHRHSRTNSCRDRYTLTLCTHTYSD